jgi:hypothetical protein
MMIHGEVPTTAGMQSPPKGRMPNTIPALETLLAINERFTRSKCWVFRPSTGFIANDNLKIGIGREGTDSVMRALP